MSNNRLVSVIIPTYKRPDRLYSALESVCGQTWKNLQIIVVDDNSDASLSSETKKVAGKFAKKVTLVYVKTPRNMGGALARNYGVKFADGEFIAFLDDDDLWHADKIKKQMSALLDSTDPLEVLSYCRCETVDDDMKRISFSKFCKSGNLFVDQLISDGVARTPAILIKKRVFTQVKGFRKLLSGQEYDLLLRIFSAGYKAKCVDDILLTAVIHTQERITNNVKKLQGEQELFEIKKKYFHLISQSSQKKIKFQHHKKMSDLYMMIENDRNSSSRELIRCIVLKPYDIFQYFKLILVYTGLYVAVRRLRSKLSSFTGTK